MVPLELGNQDMSKEIRVTQEWKMTNAFRSFSTIIVAALLQTVLLPTIGKPSLHACRFGNPAWKSKTWCCELSIGQPAEFIPLPTLFSLP
jgi:hypothetical protein